MTNHHWTLAKPASSQILLIDMQEKLASAMPQDAMQRVSQRASHLLQAAQQMQVPVIVSEQYPKGLGATLPSLAAHTSAQPVSKLAFSCCQVPAITRQLVSDKPQLVLMGMEAHICVLQTAIDLLARGKQVFVCEDAVISRDALHQHNALQRMRDAGCIITNSESVIFEWLGSAQSEHFKSLSQLIR